MRNARRTKAKATESKATESKTTGATALRPRSAPAAKARRPSPRHRLLARLWRAAERQVAQIEARLAPAGADADDGAPAARPTDAEKDARALALLARTLRELSAAEEKPDPSRDREAGSSHDDTVRDLDTFRRELARRLERLRAEGEGGEPPGRA